MQGNDNLLQGVDRISNARRSFLRAMGISTAAAGLGGALAKSASAAPGTSSGFWTNSAALANDKVFWQQVEKLFTLDKSLLFMNIGTAGSMPFESLGMLDDASRATAEQSGNGYGAHADIRAAAAAGFGCDVDELVISGNTSDGCCRVLLGLEWSPGDEIVTTNHEHPGGNVPMAIIQDRYGVVIKRVNVPVGNNQTAEDYVALFAAAITNKTKAMLWSSPTYKTGTMLPIRELVDLAISRGLISIVDGAHLPGMMAYNYRNLGMDFMAGAAHKWQCAPLGTGVLYVRNRVGSFNPLPLPKIWPTNSSSYPTGGIPPRNPVATPPFNIADRLQSCGSMNRPVYLAWGKSCAIWDQIGRQRIQDYVLSMSAALKNKIASEWGPGALYSPKDDPKLVSALTSFNPFRKPADITNQPKSTEFVTRMRTEYGIVIRNVNVPVIGSAVDHWPLRISTHLWHDFDDVDRVFSAMKDLSNKMA
jgi:selenocysteine lyase/cysteine desulfurase